MSTSSNTSLSCTGCLNYCSKNNKYEISKEALKEIAAFGTFLEQFHQKQQQNATKTSQNTKSVGIIPILSDLNKPQTSKLDWRYCEAYKIGSKKSQKGTGTKMAEKLNNFEKFERKKISNINQPDFNPILNPETS